MIKKGIFGLLFSIDVQSIYYLYNVPTIPMWLLIIISCYIVPIYIQFRQYIELLLPTAGTETSSQAVKTIRHVNHFSRKLQRRLTRRTIAEAKLLKKQGYDTVQCFVYFADLVSVYLLYTFLVSIIVFELQQYNKDWIVIFHLSI